MPDEQNKYTQLIDKYILKARHKIIEILKKMYRIKGEDLLKTEQVIYESTMIEMKKKYFFATPLSGRTTVDYAKFFASFGYKDFVDWLLVVTSIPFYQSLGDTIGYHNGNWEFNYWEPNVGPEYTNELVYEFIALGGINDFNIVNWMASDDTILYMATYQVLSDKIHTIQEFGTKLRQAYIDAIPKIENRHPGNTTMRSLNIQKNIEWDKLPYDSTEIGAGSTMRSGCIGIFFPGKHNRKKLIALAVESSRITHNSATAILGSIVAALFTAYAIEKVPVNHWPHKLLKLLKSNKIDNYMKKSRPHEYPLYARDKIIFIGQWEKYVNIRFSGLTPKLDLKHMKDLVARIDYLSKNFSKINKENPGSCGDDSVIMAYDALLESGNVLEKLIVYSILHPGDSDTVGSIALSWFGAVYYSAKNDNLVEDKFSELEFFDDMYATSKKNLRRMIKIYYYDMYLHTARKFLTKPKK